MAPHGVLLYSSMTKPQCNAMPLKDQLDCCAKQAELAFNSFKARREHQYKITLALWTLLVLTTKFDFDTLHIRPRLISLLVCAGIVVVIHTSFVCGIWLKSYFDEQAFDHFRLEGAKLLAGEVYDSSGFPGLLKFRKCWTQIRKSGSSWFQILTTILLCAACVFAIHSAKGISSPTPSSGPGRWPI